MVHVDLVAVLLGLELRGFPFAGVDPVARLGCILLGVCNLDDLVGVIVGLCFPCARVLHRKGVVLAQPNPDSFGRWHVGGGADLAEAFPLCYALADERLYRFGVVHQSTV